MTIGLAAPLGTGERFKKLSGTLAARGASNPDALAAWIGRRKYGKKGFAALSHHSGGSGHSHSHPMSAQLAILLADPGQTAYGASETGGTPASGEASVTAETQHSHEHEHTHSDGTTHTHEHTHGHDNHGSVGVGPDVPEAPSTLQTPQPVGLQSSAGFNAGSAGLHPGSAAGNYGSQSNTGHSTLDLANTRLAITSPYDIMVSRGSNGAAVVRHRRGGADIGEIQRTGDGKWTGVMGGRNLTPHTQQRAALMELLGAHNRGSVTPYHMPLQAPPAQTQLMERFGVPAIRLATPATGYASGPRVTLANGSGMSDGPDADGDNDMAGLTPKGVAIYKKLMAKGFPKERALMFAKRAQSFGGNK